MGLQAYATLLAAVRDEPNTAIGVTEAIGRSSTQRISETLWRLTLGGHLHVSAWVPNKAGRGLFLPVFAYGKGLSAPYPRPLKRPLHGVGLWKRDPRPELRGFMRILEALTEPVSRDELRQSTGYAHHRLSLLLRCMRRLGLIHIAGWNSERPGHPAQLFQMGAGPDVAKPKAKTRAQISKDYMARRKAATVQRIVFGHGCETMVAAMVAPVAGERRAA